MIEISKEGQGRERFSLAAEGPLALGAPASAPADANLPQSHISFWLDEGGNSLRVRVKYSNGTLKTATIPLT
ncbi:MAG: hypothetical protein ACREUU_16125 [Gammaproteobacteria bacterium]